MDIVIEPQELDWDLIHSVNLWASLFDGDFAIDSHTTHTEN